jgi:hypothetical protein
MAASINKLKEVELRKNKIIQYLKGGNYKTCPQIKGDMVKNGDWKELFDGLSDVQFRKYVRECHSSMNESIDVTPNHAVTGKSTLKDAEGNVKLEWVKTSIDKQQQHEAMMEAIEVMKSSIVPYKPKKKKKSKDINDKLCVQFTLTDFHIGMMSWSEESGEDWSLEKAETFLIDWFREAISLAPEASQCIFAQLGDLLHYDSIDPVTPISKHLLDTDSRYTQVVRVAIKSIRVIVDMLLEKYDNVHVLNITGNHDQSSSIWLKEMFHAFYENETRITVDRSPLPFHNFVWGKTCLFYHHGHKKNLKMVDSVFVGMFKEEFGKSKYVYGHQGHFHHQVVSESNLMIMEQHATLAPKDAYAAHGGYLSQRAAKVIVYHKEYGEVSRITINPDMLK